MSSSHCRIETYFILQASQTTMGGRNFSGIIHPSCICLQLRKPAWHMGSKREKKRVPNALHHCKDLIIRFGFSDIVPGSGVHTGVDGAAAGTMCARWGGGWPRVSCDTVSRFFFQLLLILFWCHVVDIACCSNFYVALSATLFVSDTASYFHVLAKV